MRCCERREARKRGFQWDKERLGGESRAREVWLAARDPPHTPQVTPPPACSPSGDLVPNLRCVGVGLRSRKDPWIGRGGMQCRGCLRTTSSRVIDESSANFKERVKKSVYVGPESKSLGLKFGLRVEGGKMTLEAAGKQCQAVGPSNPSAVIGMNVHGTDFAPSTRFHTVPETGYPSSSNKVLYHVISNNLMNLCFTVQALHYGGHVRLATTNIEIRGRFFGELTTFIALGNLWEGLQPDQTF
ncbi:hypothetical protein B0H13DRAFT_1918214 [Mycena leptocephala]|nr:hypothetical protein B0H13DRAFT_1918214 [Mycena leptocephala]